MEPAFGAWQVALARFAVPDGRAVLALLLGLAPVAYLGINGGGYDPVVQLEVGIALAWILLVGAASGALSGRLPRRQALAAGFLLVFACWTGVAAIWSESADRTLVEMGRAATYAAMFALAAVGVATLGARARLVAAGAAAATVVVVGLGVLSRLEPDLFTDAQETAAFLKNSRHRLAFPVNYWNGLASICAIGMPLMLHFAAHGRGASGRGVAAAGMPVLALGLFLTGSRGGALAAAVGLSALLLLSPGRVRLLASLIVSGGAAVVAIASASRREALVNGLVGGPALEQGDDLGLVLLLACTGAALLQVALAHAETGWTLRRYSWTPSLPRRAVAGVLVAFAVLAGLAVGDRAQDSWERFKTVPTTAEEARRLNDEDLFGRLGDASGRGRYELWTAALDAHRSRPLTGTGPGTFDLWWARHRAPSAEPVKNAHSLYFETLGGAGSIGFALLVAFMVTVLIGGARGAAAKHRRERTLVAACTAAFLAFCTTAALEWVWQLSVVPALACCVGAIALGAGDSRTRQRTRTPRPVSFAVAVGGVLLVLAIAVPLLPQAALQASRADARAGELAAAEAAARDAVTVAPYSAGAHLQLALVLERAGRYGLAFEEGRAATAREPTNWQVWLVLSRLAARAERPDEAVEAYRRARSLNPGSPMFRVRREAR